MSAVKKVFPVTIYSKDEKYAFDKAIEIGVFKRITWFDKTGASCEAMLTLDRFSNLVYKIYVNGTYRQEIGAIFFINSIERAELNCKKFNRLTQDDYKYI